MILQSCKRLFNFQKTIKLLERKPIINSQLKRSFCNTSKKPPINKSLQELFKKIYPYSIEIFSISAVALGYYFYSSFYVEISWKDFIRKCRNHEVTSLLVYHNWTHINVAQSDGNYYWTRTPIYKDLVNQLSELETDIIITNKETKFSEQTTIAMITLSSIFLVYNVLYSKITKKVNWQTSNTRFSDVAGCEEAKMEIIEFVNFLRNPDKYRQIGAKVPRGAILNGPPGTGKTLLAKATAGEAQVPFFSVSGGDFSHMYIGGGSKKIRKLFNDARTCAPCIIFIDEVDAIASKRIADDQSDKNRDVLQLLTEMDGVKPRDNIVILAATNRIGALDPAILRPGRLDRQIYINLPNIKGRHSIFKVYLADIKTDPSIDKTELARYLASRTTGFSGADVSNLCNEAAIIATRHNCDSVTMSHFSSAIDRVVAGLENKNRVMSKRDRNIVAHHEAGHAVAGWFLEHADPLMKVSLIPRGQHLGFALNLPIERFLVEKAVYQDQMCVLLGGRVAECIFFNSFSSGAVDDLQKVTKLATYQIAYYGFSSKLGHLNFQSNNRNIYSESTSRTIDVEIKKLVDEAYVRIEKLLLEKKDLIEKLALLLLEKDVLEREDIELVLGKRPFKERLTYEDFLEGTGSLEEDKSLPVGLQDWKK